MMLGELNNQRYIHVDNHKVQERPRDNRGLDESGTMRARARGRSGYAARAVGTCESLDRGPNLKALLARDVL